MRWIINKKRFTPLDFIGGILMNTVNMTIFLIVLDLFLRVIWCNQSNWFEESMNLMSKSDSFFANKSDAIFLTLAVVIFLLCTFCMILQWLFLNQKKDRMYVQIGSFLACGYTGEKVMRYMMADGIIDVIISMMFAYGAWRCLLNQFVQNETIQAVYLITGNQIQLLAASLGTTALFFAGIVVVHAVNWKKRRKQGDIVRLLHNTME
jgi:hypothetical protein